MAMLPNESVSTDTCNALSSINPTAPTARPVAKLLANALTKRHAEVAHRKLTTEELAALLRVVPQTIRAALCRKGHYLGLKPLKLPNGKLLWDAAEVDGMLFGGAA